MADFCIRGVETARELAGITVRYLIISLIALPQYFVSFSVTSCSYQDSVKIQFIQEFPSASNVKPVL
jgi:hypothetical protein